MKQIEKVLWIVYKFNIKSTVLTFCPPFNNHVVSKFIQRQPFYLFSEGLDGSVGLTAAAILSIQKGLDGSGGLTTPAILSIEEGLDGSGGLTRTVI